MLKLVSTNFNNTDFINLVKSLDKYFIEVDGNEHDFYNQFNNLDVRKNTVVVYLNNKPIACGAFKIYSKNCVEIKPMLTKPEVREKKCIQNFTRIRSLV